MGKNKSTLIWMIAAIALACCLVAVSMLYAFGVGYKKSEKATYPSTDAEIIDTVVDNFMQITKVPRPSHHEEKVSQFLMDWARYQGLEPVRDSVNNVMFDVPATKGMEDKPLGALQGHMDMVVAVADGKQFNKENDAVTAIRDDAAGTITADGTSLGADDGMGVAIIMAVAQGKMAHGPLRMIITVDEEDGMTGATNLDASWLNGVAYLINIDNEWSTQVLVSTAAGNNVDIVESVNFIAPTLDTAITLEISNLKGGHSGVDIDKSRLNGIRGLTKFLVNLEESGIEYELASFEGGTAKNAIPTRAKATILIDEGDKAAVAQKFSDYQAMLESKYEGIEENIVFKFEDAEMVSKVAGESAKAGFIKFITEVEDGVKHFSEDISGLVESSSNLGLAKLDPLTETLELHTLMRSSKIAMETMMLNNQVALARECGFEPTYLHTSDAWEYDPDSELLALAKEVYKRQNGTDVEVVAVHAGLECGCFKKINPTVDMISIGPDLTDPHTINETLYINSIPRVWNLLKGLLSEYTKK